jgi:hypothetical protein
MTELEQALARLEVDWPATPSFDLRAPAPTPASRSRRRPLVLGIAAAAVVAVACALAVPQSRGAILRFFHIGGETVDRVHTLPPAAERSLRASLGFRISHAGAARLLERPFAVENVPLYRTNVVVSALLPGDVLLSEWHTGNDPIVMKKLVGGATDVEEVVLEPGVTGLWIHGGRHVFIAPQLPARYAGNTLVWQRDGITFRLEGKSLTRAAAISLARPLR